MSTVLELSGSEGGASVELLEELAKAAGEEKRRFLRSLRTKSVAKRWPAEAALRERSSA